MTKTPWEQETWLLIEKELTDSSKKNSNSPNKQIKSYFEGQMVALQMLKMALQRDFIPTKEINAN